MSREVFLPPPHTAGRYVTVPDTQCGQPVNETRDGADIWTPCNRLLGHQGWHADDSRCEHEFRWGSTAQRCTQLKFHTGLCSNGRYVAEDVYGAGEGL